MTDAELLQAAARAAGLYPHIKPDGTMLVGNTVWNPLEDDGDAFRLAVKLQMRTNAGPYRAVAMTPEQLLIDVLNDESVTTDPCAAMRRVIVRAAASSS